MSSYDPNHPMFHQQQSRPPPGSPFQPSLTMSSDPLVSSISSITSTSNAQKSDSKAEQLVQQFYSKVAQIVIQSRIPSSSNSSSRQAATTPPRAKKSNKWFNLELVDSDMVREDLKPWRSQLYASNPAPPSLIIDILLDISNRHDSQYLMVYNTLTHRRHRISPEYLTYVDSSGKSAKKTKILLETWQLSLSKTVFQNTLPDLPVVYKKSIVFFRSLYSICRQLPGYKLANRIDGNDPSSYPFKIQYRLSNGRIWDPSVVGFDQLHIEGDTSDGLVEDTLSPIETPLGMLSLHLMFRSNCYFEASAIESESPLLSTQDEHFFRTSSHTLNTNPYPHLIQASRQSSGSSTSTSHRQRGSLSRKLSEVGDRPNRASLSSTPSSNPDHQYRMYIGSLKNEQMMPEIGGGMGSISKELGVGSLSPQVVAFTPTSTQMQYHGLIQNDHAPPFAQRQLQEASRSGDSRIPHPIGSPPFSLHSQNSLDRSRKSVELPRRSSITFYSSSPSSFELRSATPPRPPLLFTPSGSFTHPILTGLHLSGSPSPVLTLARFSNVGTEEQSAPDKGDDIHAFLQETLEQSKVSLTSYPHASQPHRSSHSNPTANNSFSRSSRRIMDLGKFQRLKEEHSTLTESVLGSQAQTLQKLPMTSPGVETRSLQLVPRSFPSQSSSLNYPGSLPKQLPSQHWGMSTGHEDSPPAVTHSLSSQKQSPLTKIEEASVEQTQAAVQSSSGSGDPLSGVMKPPEPPFALETISFSKKKNSKTQDTTGYSLWTSSSSSASGGSSLSIQGDEKKSEFTFEKKPISKQSVEVVSSLLPLNSLPLPPFALAANRSQEKRKSIPTESTPQLHNEERYSTGQGSGERRASEGVALKDANERSKLDQPPFSHSLQDRITPSRASSNIVYPINNRGNVNSVSEHVHSLDVNQRHLISAPTGERRASHTMYPNTFDNPTQRQSRTSMTLVSYHGRPSHNELRPQSHIHSQSLRSGQPPIIRPPLATAAPTFSFDSPTRDGNVNTHQMMPLPSSSAHAQHDEMTLSLSGSEDEDLLFTMSELDIG